MCHCTSYSDTRYDTRYDIDTRYVIDTRYDIDRYDIDTRYDIDNRYDIDTTSAETALAIGTASATGANGEKDAQDGEADYLSSHVNDVN